MYWSGCYSSLSPFGISAKSKNCAVTSTADRYQAAAHEQKTRGVAFCAQPVLMAAHATMQNIMLSLCKNCDATDQQFDLRVPYRDAVGRTSKAVQLDDNWGLVAVSCCCVKLVVGIWGSFCNPEEGVRPPFKAATKQRLVKTVTDWENRMCPTVICETSGMLAI
jgi:hypothetical protein